MNALFVLLVFLSTTAYSQQDEDTCSSTDSGFIKINIMTEDEIIEGYKKTHKKKPDKIIFDTTGVPTVEIKRKKCIFRKKRNSLTNSD